MKRILKTCMIAIGVLLFSAVQNKSSAQVAVNVSFQTFYDDLSPYGQWINYPEYGYVWSPDSRYKDFHPYRSEGHWAWSEDYGWLWVSDYEWGWAPFHYGRWVYDSYQGWLWVPDYEWGPAWVVWRGGGDYYGWAPMSPGININLYSGNRYSVPNNYWCFAPRRYINSPRISNYYLDRGRNTIIINNTTIINNYGGNRDYVMGPYRSEVERYTGSRISPVRIRESQRAGRTIARNNEVSIYKPYINRGSDRGTPGTFEDYRQKSQGETIDRNTARQDRPYQDRGSQRIERQQFPGQNDQRVERQQVPDQNNQRIERPYQNPGGQRIERQQLPDQNSQRVERQQVPDENTQRVERPYQNRGSQRIERQQFPGQNDQRVERQQVPDQNTQRLERPYRNRGSERIERQQFPNQNNQRMERQQVPDQNTQRVERQQMPSPRVERQQEPNPNSQRVERPYQSRGQQSQVQNQPAEQQRGNGNGRWRGRGN